MKQLPKCLQKREGLVLIDMLGLIKVPFLDLETDMGKQEGKYQFTKKVENIIQMQA